MEKKSKSKELAKKVNNLEKEVINKHKIEEALEDKKRLCEALLKISTQGLLLHNRGIVVVLNDSLANILAYDSRELIGKDIIKACALPEYHGIIYEKMADHFQEPYLIKVKRKDGIIIPLMIERAKNIQYKGQNLRIASVRNITEQMLLKKELQESKERYRELAESLPETVYEIDMNGNLTFVNYNAYNKFGFTQQDFNRGLNGFNMITPEDRSRALKNFKKVLGGEKVDFSEYTALRKDGSTFPCLLFSALRFHDEKPVGLRGIIIDISEKKNAEEDKRKLEEQLQQAQKMEAIGTLAGGIAHDFNNILMAILGNADISLYELPEDHPARENIEQILKAAYRASDLVKQILAFSRQTEQKFKPVKICVVIDEVFKLLRASLPATIEIRKNINTYKDTVLANPTQIHQVLMNLCTNAYHAMGEEGGVLEISLKNINVEFQNASKYPDLAAGSYVKITVSDTGHGIEPDIILNIFDPYFTTKERETGTGLGLAMAHEIMKAHKGLITVESESRKGTTFNVFFPLIQYGAITESTVFEPIPTGNERILFVDDEEALANLGKRMLQNFGYKVDAITSSIKALEIFQAKPEKYDLIITDTTMPKMTGEKLAKKLISIRPNIPIILCTGFSEVVSEEKARALGIRAYITKPFIMSDLARIIRTVLEGK